MEAARCLAGLDEIGKIAWATLFFLSFLSGVAEAKEEVDLKFLPLQPFSFFGMFAPPPTSTALELAFLFRDRASKTFKSTGQERRTNRRFAFL